MKALKEKRVSLRSLFRRSLVILSLLALAFAIGSCADTSGDSGGDTPPPPPPPPVVPVTPVVTLKTVQSVTVLSHPYLPSYEGAAPNLEGLKALVIFTDGTAYPVGADSFATYPPIAYIDNNTHTSVTRYSAYNQYTILYNGDNAFPAAESTRVNVYIPGVIALQNYLVYDYDPTMPNHVERYIRLSRIDEIYEDQDISPKNLKLTADYNLPFAEALLAGNEPLDYVSDRWILGTGVRPRGQGEDYPLWPNYVATDNPLTKQASNNPSVWRIDRIGRRAEYLITVDKTLVAPDDFLIVPAIIGTFYEVDRFEYDPDNGSDFRYIKLTADDTMRDYEWWWKVFNYADLRFNVTYFDSAAPNDPTKKPVRQIGVNEYTRAMYTVGADGNAKATVPMLTGNTGQEPAYPDSDIISSVVLDYPLSARLYYYDRLIQGPPGQGQVDPDLVIYTNNWLDPYYQPNVAIVPITDNNIIFVYDRLEVSRRDNTNHPDATAGYPYVVSSAIPTTAASYANYLQYSAENVFLMLKKYWKVEWVYINDNRPGEECRFEIRPDLTPDQWRNGTFAIGPGLNPDYDFSAVDEREERDVTLTFKAPPSTASKMVLLATDPATLQAVSNWAAWTQREEDGDFGYVMLP